MRTSGGGCEPGSSGAVVVAVVVFGAVVVALRVVVGGGAGAARALASAYPIWINVPAGSPACSSVSVTSSAVTKPRWPSAVGCAPCASVIA